MLPEKKTKDIYLEIIEYKTEQLQQIKFWIEFSFQKAWH